MTSQEVWIFRASFGLVAGFFAVLAALFIFLDTRRDESQKPIKDWFGKYWDKLKSSRWLKLPNKIIKSVLFAERFINTLPSRLFKSSLIVGICIFTIPILTLVAAWVLWGIWIALSLSALQILAIIWINNDSLEEKLKEKIGGSRAKFVGSCIIGLCFLVTAIILLVLSFSVSLQLAIVVMLVSLPLFWFLSLGPLIIIGAIVEMFGTDYIESVGDSIFNYFAPFFLGVSISLTVTYASFIIGSLSVPIAYIPRTVQMLASNVIFDGLTMVITINILRQAIAKPGIFRIPMAVFLDILAAGILACCSIYFGLVGTSYALDYQQILNVLIAKSPDGSIYQLGPYFWAMHTTFLPTLFYLLVIILAWAGKALLTPISWFFGIGHVHKNPLKLTATLFTLFSVLFSLLWFSTGELQSYLKEQESTTPVKTHQRNISPQRR